MLEELSKMSIDIAFLTIDGLSLRRGMTSTSYSEAEIKKTIVKWNKKIVLLADCQKFEREALFSFGSFDQATAIVTNDLPPGEYEKACRLRNIALITPENRYSKQCAT